MRYGRNTVILSLLLAVVSAGIIFYFYFTRRGLPEYVGEIEGPVEAEVKIYRDDHGIPHIEAENVEDLFQAQGYVQAQDRIWQMDMLRRTLQGRLSQVMGEDALFSDRFHLTVGFERAALKSWQKLGSEARRMLKAHARGVNMYLEKQDDLPPQFALTGHEPGEWKPEHSLLLHRYLSWIMAGNMETELFLSALKAGVREEKAQELFPRYPDEGKAVIEQGDYPVFEEEEAAKLLSLAGAVAAGIDFYGNELPGSNSWAVRSEREDKALLASDMHLMLGIPPVWYLQSLKVEDDIDVYGAIMPGIPGIIAGFNQDIAWGLTNVGADVKDLFTIRLAEGKEDHYRHEDELLSMDTLEIKIPVEGRDEPEELVVRKTHHGPIISDVVGLDRGRALSLKWTGFRATAEPERMLELMTAGDWQDFSRAASEFANPSLNFIYADHEGNIGYQMGGKIPIRPEGEGLLPAPGWKEDYEWVDYIPPEELPAIFNPEEDYLVSANNKVIGEEYPHHITHEWAPPYRAERIEDRLQEIEGTDLEETLDIQGDKYNLQAERLLPVFLAALSSGEALDGEKEAALEVLEKWQDNPVDCGEKSAPLLYHSLYLQVIENIFRERLGDRLYAYLLDYNALVNVMDEMLISGDSDWFIYEDKRNEEARDAIIRDSFNEVVQKLKNEEESPPSEWEWGENHQLNLSHLLSEIDLLSLFLDRGPLSPGGSGVTPPNLAYHFSEPFQIVHGAPWRFAVATDNMSGRDVLAPGNSGHPFNPHYDDQLESWSDWQHRQIPEREEFEEVYEPLKIIPE